MVARGAYGLLSSCVCVCVREEGRRGDGLRYLVDYVGAEDKVA